MNGLAINEKEFMGMGTKRQLTILYQNQVVTLKLIKGYKFTQKVQYAIMSSLVAGLGILFRLKLGA